MRRSLLPLIGRRCVGVRVLRPSVIDPQTRSGSRSRSRGSARPTRLLAGLVIDRLDRHGKHLAIVTKDGPALDIQLGMTGQVLTAPAGLSLDCLTHLHVIWRLDDGSSFGFRDPRRFGGIWPSESFEALVKDRWEGLGPDGLTLTPELLAGRLSGSKRPIKLALMDQGVVAGLGNIYVAEALFEAGISPLKACHRVPDDAVRRLAVAIRRTLQAAVEAGGSTLRDYANARGEAGAFQQKHLVYGRGGLACVRCGHALRQRAIGQRTTVWCPACQR